LTTSQQDIKQWLEDAKRKNATHMIVVCDSFDYEDYPVLVLPGQDVRKVFDEYSGKAMQRVMEVYALHLD
jgi:protoheme ferro-lyase